MSAKEDKHEYENEDDVKNEISLPIHGHCLKHLINDIAEVRKPMKDSYS